MIRPDITWGELEEEFYVWYDMTGQDEFQGHTLDEIKSHDPNELVVGE